jgi:CHAD domain-containing protein
MAASMTEIERKYDAPPGTEVPWLEVLPQVASARRSETERLEADYFDTEDLRLIRAGITLRRRQGGADAGWHLKLPAAPGARCEVRLPAGPHGRRVPAELADLVSAYVRTEPLRPVARITTRRQLMVLLDPSGGALAEVATDDVFGQALSVGAKPARWREVEIELARGDDSLLRAADTVLRQCGLRPAGHSTKLARVLGIPQPSGNQPLLTPAATAGQIVLAYLRKQAAALKALDPMVRQDEPDAVHQMRVTTRRLRSTLRTFATLLPASRAATVAVELKWLGGVLGRARDAEVLPEHLLTRLRQLPAEQVIGPVRARVQGHFAPLRASARGDVVAALRSRRYLRLLDELDTLLARPLSGPIAGKPADRVLRKALRRRHRQTAQRMRKALRARQGRAADAALHQARKAAKRARYAGEAATPALGRETARFTRRMKRLQSVLGDHQDSVIARQAIRQLGVGAHLAGENAFTYGLLYGHDDCAAERLQAQARRAWRRAFRAGRGY